MNEAPEGRAMDMGKMLNPAVAAIPASVTLGVDTRAKEMAAAGK